MNRLAEKIAIVTGGASGIGKEVVSRFVQEGATVISCDVNLEALEKNAAGSDHIIPKKLDVTSEDAWVKLANEVAEKYGRIDILVNNAGVASDKGLEDTTAEDWAFQHNINSLGPFLGIKAVTPHMKKAGKGSIVNNVSYTALIGSGLNAYTGSKGSARAVSRAAATTLGMFQIRVNSVYPGVIETPMSAAIQDYKEILNQLVAATPLQRLGKPEEVANAVLFLASDEAAYITGAELVIDGGYTAQ